MLRSIYDEEEGSLTTAYKLEYLIAALRNRPGPRSGNDTSSGDNRAGRQITTPRPEEANLEDVSIQFLSTYSTHITWRQTVSLTNDYGQTLAHIAVAFGFLRLLQHLVAWGIDLQAQDDMGLTALHHAYFFQQQECITFLLRSGANRLVLDHLGRTPSALGPQQDKEPGVDYSDSCVDDHNDISSRHVQVPDCDTNTPEVENPDAKDLLVQNWILKVNKDHPQGPFPSRRKVSGDTEPLNDPPTINSCSSQGEVPLLISCILLILLSNNCLRWC